MAVEIFRFDDAGYEAWLRAHRHDGYVVNARQRITPAYLRCTAHGVTTSTRCDRHRRPGPLAPTSRSAQPVPRRSPDGPTTSSTRSYKEAAIACLRSAALAGILAARAAAPRTSGPARVQARAGPLCWPAASHTRRQKPTCPGCRWSAGYSVCCVTPTDARSDCRRSRKPGSVIRQPRSMNSSVPDFASNARTQTRRPVRAAPWATGSRRGNRDRQGRPHEQRSSRVRVVGADSARCGVSGVAV